MKISGVILVLVEFETKIQQNFDITKYFGQKSAQNKEKSHFIPHMLAYVGIFLYLCTLNFYVRTNVCAREHAKARVRI